MTLKDATLPRVLLPALLLTVWVPIDGRAQTASPQKPALKTPSPSDQTKPDPIPLDTDYAEPAPTVP